MKHLYINGTSMIHVALETLHNIKFASWFPHKTGNLRHNATKVDYNPEGGFVVWFDETKAPYIPFLEFGTNPHFIPYAFGRNAIVFHPGSDKHKGFIENKSSKLAADTIAMLLNGKVHYYVND